MNDRELLLTSAMLNMAIISYLNQPPLRGKIDAEILTDLSDLILVLNSRIRELFSDEQLAGKSLEALLEQLNANYDTDALLAKAKSNYPELTQH